MCARRDWGTMRACVPISRLVAIALVALPLAVGAVDVPPDALDHERLEGLPISSFPLLAGWRFHPGHSPDWAEPRLDDSEWLALDSLELGLGPAAQQRLEWSGSGWFRLRLQIDESFPDRPVGLMFSHAGALEIYFDGELLVRLGQVGDGPDDEIVEAVNNPPGMSTVRLVPGGSHVLAVRYSNHWALSGFSRPEEPGFLLFLAEPAAYHGVARAYLAGHDRHQMLAVVPIAFAVLHVLLYLYYRERIGNLWYAVFAFSVGAMLFAPLQLSFASTPAQFVTWELIFEWSIVFSVLSGLLFLYVEFLDGPGRLFWVAFAAGVVGVVLAWALPRELYYYFSLVVFIALVRALYLGLRRRPVGAWVVGFGWLSFVVGVTLQILMELGITRGGDDPTQIWLPYIYGTIVLVVSMSVYLARDVARTSHELAEQLVQVQELSKQALEHERQVQAAKLTTLTNLVAGIVHEMNTPVGAIRSARDTLSRAVEALLRGLVSAGGAAPDDERLRKPFAAIGTANAALGSGTDRLGQILTNFKAFSRLDEAEWQVADLEAGLESALAVMGSQIDACITIDKAYGGVDPIYCSPARLNQVFRHLITNALAAIDGSGTIRLQTSQDDDHVHVRVEDTGAGIPADQLDGLFDVGFRRRARVKMGMGLIADHSTVREHDGDMEITSQVGVGTQVVVRLPRRRR